MKITVLGPLPEQHVVISIHEKKPYGMPDGHRIDVISLEERAPPLSCRIEAPPSHFVGTWMCWLQLKQCWVGYYLCSCQENGAGPNEEDARGPYLFHDAPPTDDERRLAAAERTLIIRTDWRF